MPDVAAPERSQPGGADICVASIVIPAFNEAPSIRRAIDSALAQSESLIEVIVIDDASTDDTASIARSYRDSRVRVLSMPENRGPAAARNAGFAHANGTWVALLDADDAYRPHRIRRLAAIGDASGADLVSDNMLLLEQGAPPRLLFEPSEEATPRRMTAAAFIAGNIGDKRDARASYGFMQPMFRRRFLQHTGLRHDERNRFGEDFMLYASCLRAGAAWWHTGAAMYEYTVRQGSLAERQTADDLGRLLEFNRDYLDDPAVVASPALKRALRTHGEKLERLYTYRAVTDAVKQGRFEDAFRVVTGSTRRPALFIEEAWRQAPIIGWKALRGGYLPNRR